MSFWWKELSETDNCDDIGGQNLDVVVVGCGISGASTAYHIKRNDPSLKVLVLEKGVISSGATGCNGGFICPGTSEKFSASVERYGLDVTLEIYDYTVKCTEAVKSFVRDSASDCELRFHGCVQLAMTEEELAALKLSFEQLKSFHQQVDWWDIETCRMRTHSNSFLGGLFKPQAGMLWAAKLVHALIAQARTLGVKVVTHCAVTNVTDINPGGIITVHTSKGTVHTRKVVYCTNAWTRELLPELQELIVPVRNQLIMTEPVERLWDFSLSANSGYEYFMQRPDGRILLGGMRNLVPGMEVNSADPVSLNATVSAALRGYLLHHFPTMKPVVGTDTDTASRCDGFALKGTGKGSATAATLTSNGATATTTAVSTAVSTANTASTTATTATAGTVKVDYEWIGIMGFTPDRNPLVGPLAHHPGQYVLAGYTGHGMPVAFLAGANVADMICGKVSTVPVPRAYAPSRFNL